MHPRLCTIAACVLLAFKDDSGLGKSALISLPFWIAASRPVLLLFVPGLPHGVTLLEWRLALIPYQDHHMLLLAHSRSCISGCAGFYYTVQRRNHHKHAGDIRRLINQALLLVVLGPSPPPSLPLLLAARTL